MIKNISIRILLFIVVIVLSYFSSNITSQFVTDLGYQNPSGFFGFSLTSMFLALWLSLVFWSGVVFGAWGRKVDYIIITAITLFALWDYLSAENLTQELKQTFVISVIAGNLIGYILKLGRERFLAR